MSERELKATLIAHELGVGPHIIDYQPAYHHKIDIVPHPELEDPLDEWETFTRRNMENGEWYTVSMKPLCPVERKDINRDMIVEYCKKLIARGVYHMDIHEENIMKDDEGKLILIDYGHIIMQSDPYPFPLENLTGERLVPNSLKN